MLGVFSNLFTILFLALPIFSAVRLILRRQTLLGQWVLWAVLASAGCYVLLLLSVITESFHLDNVLYQYDLNGDGGFSGIEINPAMEQAMEDASSDTGRTFAPFTGLVTCPIYSGFWHFVMGVPYLMISARKRRNWRKHFYH